MKKLLACVAMICLLGIFAWVGGIESGSIDFWLGCLLLMLSVIGFGVSALAAQSYVEVDRK